MHVTLARVLTAAAAAAALTLAGAAVTDTASAATTPAATTPAATAPAPAAGGRAVARHVVVAGIGGLRWSDISPGAAPALWRLARQGSVGSLIVRAATPHTCPGDDWLTLNAAARAALTHPPAGSCPGSPRVVVQPATAAGAGTPASARVPAMPGLVSSNARYSQNPQWGLLATAAGPGRCTTAVGPGAALALATRSGEVPSYLPSESRLTRADLARCPLTVIGLGNLPPAAGPAARAAAVRSAGRRLAAIDAKLPAGTLLLVAGLGDGTPHLQVIIVSGPGYRAGLLSASSTRQPGMVVITDLTPTVLGWLGRPVPPVAVGSQVRSTSRSGLAPAVRMLAGQDTAAGVYRTTMAPFFLVAGFGYLAAFVLIWAIGWGGGDARRRYRRSIARVAGAWAGAVPAGTFLAGLVPWWAYAHPAAVLYSLTAGWAAVVAAVALAGPWRRDPLGPAGVVATVTLGVIAVDMMTGSRLQLETPFGLGILVAGRYYGLGNNAVVIYAASAALCAAWLASVALRRGQRTQGLAVMAAVLAFAVAVAGWPGFGAKVGATIAMVPGFLLLLAVTAHVRVTVSRALLIAVSGAALVTAFALINYLAPVTGSSDMGGFVGQALHGGAGSILQRKIGSNLGSLTENPFVPLIPAVVAVLGLLVFWPTRLRAHLLARAYRDIPLLRGTLSAVWLVAVLGWFAEDSGVTVPAAGLPLVLPLVIVILSSLPARGEPAVVPTAGGGPNGRVRPAVSRHLPGDVGPGQPHAGTR